MPDWVAYLIVTCGALVGLLMLATGILRRDPPPPKLPWGDRNRWKDEDD